MCLCVFVCGSIGTCDPRVSVHVCVWECGHIWSTVSMCGGQRTTLGISSVLPHLVWQSRIYHGLPQASLCGFSCLILLPECWGYRCSCLYPTSPRIWSLCLHGKCFTHQITSPAPGCFFFFFRDIGLLSRPGYPSTCDPTTSVFWVLRDNRDVPTMLSW